MSIASLLWESGKEFVLVEFWKYCTRMGGMGSSIERKACVMGREGRLASSWLHCAGEGL